MVRALVERQLWKEETFCLPLDRMRALEEQSLCKVKAENHRDQRLKSLKLFSCRFPVSVGHQVATTGLRSDLRTCNADDQDAREP